MEQVPWLIRYLGRIGLGLALMMLCIAPVPVTAKTPLRVCKQTCITQVAGACANFKKGKLKLCRTRLWRLCKRGVLFCVPSTTSTTIPLCLSPFTVSPEYPALANAGISSGDFNRDGKVDIVGVGGPAPLP